MSFAQIGPLTSLLESGATAVGAGLLLAGFLTGLIGLILGWSRREIENRIFRESYVGGIAGAGALIADITFRYAL